jgi:hypothetical protein
MDSSAIVLETRAPVRGSMKYVFQKSLLVSVSKSKSLRSAQLAFGSQILRLELTFFICVCELADKHFRLVQTAKRNDLIKCRIQHDCHDIQ